MALEVISLKGAGCFKDMIIEQLLPKYIKGFSITPNQWINNTYTAYCPDIKSDSIICIYYNESNREYVESLNTEKESGDGYFKIKAGVVPTKNVVIDYITIENPVVDQYCTIS